MPYRLKSLLSDIYDTSENPGKIIIFVETKRRVDNLVRFIRSFGVRCGAIHGDKSQSERDFVLREFRSGKSNILVATDVAARGLGKLTLCMSNSPCFMTIAPSSLCHTRRTHTHTDTHTHFNICPYKHLLDMHVKHAHSESSL